MDQKEVIQNFIIEPTGDKYFRLKKLMSVRLDTAELQKVANKSELSWVING
jgi:hypothetical protein